MPLYAPSTISTHIHISSLSDSTGTSIPCSTTYPGCIGILPIFDNYNDAITAFPDTPIITLPIHKELPK